MHDLSSPVSLLNKALSWREQPEKNKVKPIHGVLAPMHDKNHFNGIQDMTQIIFALIEYLCLA